MFFLPWTISDSIDDSVTPYEQLADRRITDLRHHPSHDLRRKRESATHPGFAHQGRIVPRKARATTSDFSRYHPAASASSSRAAARKTTRDFTPRRRLRGRPRSMVRWSLDRFGAPGGVPQARGQAHPRPAAVTDPQESNPRSRRRAEASRKRATCGSQRCLSRRYSMPFPRCIGLLAGRLERGASRTASVFRGFTD